MSKKIVAYLYQKKTFLRCRYKTSYLYLEAIFADVILPVYGFMYKPQIQSKEYYISKKG